MCQFPLNEPMVNGNLQDSAYQGLPDVLNAESDLIKVIHQGSGFPQLLRFSPRETHSIHDGFLYVLWPRHHGGGSPGSCCTCWGKILSLAAL